jgi:diguanylate cyclase (GGDEF)-like protein/PAS domain S-box-containing protein
MLAGGLLLRGSHGPAPGDRMIAPADAAVTAVVMIASAAYLAMAWAVARNDAAPAARYAAPMMIACFCWSLGALLRDLATSLELFLLASNVAYVGIATLPALGFLLVRDLRGRPIGARWPLVLALPVLTVVLVWTNPWHELLWVHPAHSASAELLHQVAWGPWYLWVHIPFSYGLATISAWALARGVVLGPLRSGIALGRTQAFCMLVATVLPAATSAMVTAGLSDNGSWTPVALAVSGVLFGWAFFGLRLFELRPFAYRQIFAAMRDAIIVLDESGRVIDANPAARALFPLPERTDPDGATATELAETDPELGSALASGREVHLEYRTSAGASRELDVRWVLDHRGRRQARALLLRDITARTAAEAALRQQEAMIRGIVDQSPNGILRLRPVSDLGPDWFVTFFNPAACRCLGVAPGDLAGARLSVIQPDTLPRLVPLFRHVHATGDTEGIELPARPDSSGVVWWFRVIASRAGDELLVTLVDISDQKQRQIELARAAATDPLTGLLNRRGLEARAAEIDRAAERGDRPAVLYFDLDGFKAINDGYGHEAGDRILQEFARRLTAAAAAGDPVVRIGGDEFVVVVMQPGDDADPATEFRVALAPPYPIGRGSVSCPPSIGVGRFGPDGLSLGAVLWAGDRAMYAARGRGLERTV